MKPNGMRIGAMLVTLLCTIPCLAQPLARADRPAVKVGDRFVYRETNGLTGEQREISMRVTAVTADRIVVETGLSTSGAWTFTRDWNLVERKGGDVVAAVLTPYWPYFEFPLEVGKEWQAPFENEVLHPGKRHAKWQWKARVVGAETVTVPAGTFQTLKIEAEGTFTTRSGSRSWTGSHHDTFWYAPEVKRPVKRDYQQSAPANNSYEQHTDELLSFELAP